MNSIPVADAPNPADMLAGLELEGGWKITAKLPQQIELSPGYFSVGYIVERDDGTLGFLKALDLKRLLNEGPWLQAVQRMTTAFQFEVAMLEKVKSKRMDRVVTALQHGYVTAPVSGIDPALANVPYIIFEKAESDVRVSLDVAHRSELAFRLRIMHHVTTGLVQLHKQDIAHQDLKPGNVLVYKKDESRVSDLGTASEKGVACPRDNVAIAGDKRYAPPEQLYNHLDPDWTRRRLAADAYLLGSLLVFFFTRASVTVATVRRMHPDHYPGRWPDTYPAVLPYFRQAWETVMEGFDEAVKPYANEIAPEIGEAARQLCEPDPELRGHPVTRMRPGNRYSLDRYINLFNRLASRAEYGRV